jgi:hypothetical protein
VPKTSLRFTVDKLGAEAAGAEQAMLGAGSSLGADLAKFDDALSLLSQLGFGVPARAILAVLEMAGTASADERRGGTLCDPAAFGLVSMKLMK